MYIFSVDILGLVNAQKMPLDHLAKKAGLLRHRVHYIAKVDQRRIHRVKVAKMLKALGVEPYPPLFYGERNGELALSVDWKHLLEINDANIPWLVRRTKLRRHRIRHMLNADPAEYDRVVLGTTLHALGVSVYPPFFIENESEQTKREPYEYRPASRYYRTRKE